VEEHRKPPDRDADDRQHYDHTRLDNGPQSPCESRDHGAEQRRGDADRDRPQELCDGRRAERRDTRDRQ
jgi:hypothetical protein